MVPTVIPGDYVLVNEMAYGLRIPSLGLQLPGYKSPERFKPVVFVYPLYERPGLHIEVLDFLSLGLFGLTNTPENPKYFVKRIIGMPGDRLSLQNNKLTINDVKLTYAKVTRDKYLINLYSIKDPLNQSQTPEGKHYYVFNSRGDLIGLKGESVLMERFGTSEHLIQLANRSSSLSDSDIHFLYIPKRGDTLRFTDISDNSPRGFLQLSLNGKKLGIINQSLFETYYSTLSRYGTKIAMDKDIQIASDYYFVLGDNRNNSSDSREWGFVSADLLIGSPLMIYYPYERFGLAVQ